MELQHNFPLIPSINTTQINKILEMPRQPSETVIAQIRFLYNISKNEHFNAKDIRPAEFLEL